MSKQCAEGATGMTTHTRDEVTVDRPAPRVRERPARDRAGLPVLGLSLLALFGGTGLLTWSRVMAGHGGGGAARTVVLLMSGLLIVLGGVALGGLTAVAPGQARVVQLFGRYSGTIRTP